MADPFDLAALERLEALERKATWGPWECEESALDRDWNINGDVNQDSGAHDGPGWVANLGICGEDDARFIVALRNAAPALLRAARAAAGAGGRGLRCSAC